MSTFNPARSPASGSIRPSSARTRYGRTKTVLIYAGPATCAQGSCCLVTPRLRAPLLGIEVGYAIVIVEKINI